MESGSGVQGGDGGLGAILRQAEAQGLVAAAKSEQLAAFLVSRGVSAGPPVRRYSPQDAGLDLPRAADPPTELEESEAPRFLRGFHDILITLGIIIGLVGVGGLASIFAAIPAVIVLAEIFVRRQRLALPAVVLTIALAIAIATGMMALFDFADSRMNSAVPSAVLAAVAVMVLLFYWRYQVPLALATGLVMLFAALVVGAAVASRQMAGADLFDRHPWLVALFIGIFAALVFGTALRFDLADRLRVTRRSDVAFWMHLAAAPAILYTIIAAVYLGQASNWFDRSASFGQAAAVVAAVLGLMLLGIVLDRRAFVTSGLLSFGYAIGVLISQGGVARLAASADTIVFVTLLLVSLVVLSLGLGWQPLRRHIISYLPPDLQARLAPVRSSALTV